MSDRLELVQLPARCERDVVVGERIRPEHASRDRDRRHSRLDAPPEPEERRAPCERRRQESRRRHRDRLPAHPGRADRDDRARAEHDDAEIGRKLPGSAAPGPPEPDAGRRRPRARSARRSAPCRADGRGSRPTGQIPNAWSLLSGPNRFPSSVSARNDDTFGSQSIAATIAGTASTTTPAAKTPSLSGTDRTGRRTRSTTAITAAGRSHAAAGRLSTQTIAAHTAASGRTARADERGPSVQGTSTASSANSQAPGQLLDPAPERVAEQDRRLRRDEGRECSHRPQWDERLEQRVQRERQHRGEERDVRLEDPGEVVADERVPDPDRHQDARRDSRPRAWSPASPRTSTARARRGRARVPSRGRSSRSTSRCRRA